MVRDWLFRVRKMRAEAPHRIDEVPDPTPMLDHFEKKSLSAFSFGNNGFLLAPEMSNQVLSCIVDPTDVTGLVNPVNIRAVRAYERAGFTRERMVDTPDGPALLMVRDRTGLS